MPSSYAFPPDLIAAQDELCRVRVDLQELFKEVPWATEPLPEWETHPNAWRHSSRPASPGWTPRHAEDIARLRAREVELAQLIVTHGFWKELAPAGVPAARDALKHHDGQPVA